MEPLKVAYLFLSAVAEAIFFQVNMSSVSLPRHSGCPIVPHLLRGPEFGKLIIASTFIGAKA